MTSTPSLPAQIETREPGWYWVRVFEGAPWHPYHWYHSRDGEAFWVARSVDDAPMFEIGPRIPDPVTLQQHERDDTRIKQLDDECQRFMREVALLREGHERLEAALRVVLSYAEAQPPNALERINAVARAALDTAAPETPTDTELVLSRKDVAENSGGRR